MLATEFLQFSHRIPLFSIFIPFLCLNIRQNKRTIAYLGINEPDNTGNTLSFVALKWYPVLQNGLVKKHLKIDDLMQKTLRRFHLVLLTFIDPIRDFSSVERIKNPNA